MKTKKRAGAVKYTKSDDTERKRKINAAIRHAEQVIKKTGVYAPVIFRSALGSVQRPQVPASPPPRAPDRRKSGQSAGARPANPAMDEAFRKALNIPPKSPPAPREPLSVKSSLQHLIAAKAAPPKIQRPADPTESVITRPQTKSAGVTANKPSKTLAKKAKKKVAKKATKSISRQLRKAGSSNLEKLAEKLRVERINRKTAKESNDDSRRALNARLNAAKEADRATGQSPFERLQRDWFAAFKILQRYEVEGPNDVNVVAARNRLDLIEAEWERRHALKPGDPDYFPWPSTDINPGSSSRAPIERREVGMLSYLGYHVGISSQLTGTQRVRLLDQIFTMRLPPLNGLDYMKDWGAPRTGPRLRKIADNLASFVKSAKGRNLSALETAIGHWEADLSHLRRHYYDGRFDFLWPRI